MSNFVPKVGDKLYFNRPSIYGKVNLAPGTEFRYTHNDGDSYVFQMQLGDVY